MPTPVSLYLHVPFCTVKCAYCDFNSYADIEELIPAWESALLEELRRWSQQVTGRPVPTVFIGGGTPTLLTGESIARIMDEIRSLYDLEPTAEVTLEGNPESVALDRLQAYREAGVNRLSMGVQSLDARELRFLDRIHSAERAEEAFHVAREAGFDNVNLDLIFGLPGQSLASWQRTLDEVLRWQPEHLSCYALIVEDGTPLAQRVSRGEVIEADADLVAEMAEQTERRLATAGYRQYEISNYAREAGGDGECRHNLVYWRHGEYVGVGPGAHGFVDGVRYAVERSPLRYARLMAVGGGAHGVASPAAVSAERISDETAALDTFVMGMRLNAGIDTKAFARRYPTPWASFQEAIDWGARAGLTSTDGAQLCLTSKGRRLANELFVRVMEPSLV